MHIHSKLIEKFESTIKEIKSYMEYINDYLSTGPMEEEDVELLGIVCPYVFNRSSILGDPIKATFALKDVVTNDGDIDKVIIEGSLTTQTLIDYDAMLIKVANGEYVDKYEGRISTDQEYTMYFFEYTTVFSKLDFINMLNQPPFRNYSDKAISSENLTLENINEICDRISKNLYQVTLKALAKYDSVVTDVIFAASPVSRSKFNMVYTAACGKNKPLEVDWNNINELSSCQANQLLGKALISGTVVKQYNVGQANCTLVEGDYGKFFFDIGFSRESTCVKYIEKEFSGMAIMVSHFDIDHILGVCIDASILKCNWIIPNFEDVELSLTARRLIAILKIRSRGLYKVSKSVVGFKHKILKGNGKVYAHCNKKNSSGIILEIKDNVLLMGDCVYDAVENPGGTKYLTGKCYGYVAAAHHGCNLDNIDLTFNAKVGGVAVISCGLSNHYGHPDKDHVNKLKSHGFAVYETKNMNRFIYCT